MEVLATERTLTELDHVRLMNIINRISRGESAELGTQDVERVLDTAVLVPSRGMAADTVSADSTFPLCAHIYHSVIYMTDDHSVSRSPGLHNGPPTNRLRDVSTPHGIQRHMSSTAGPER
jgi:hypothetical protein